MQRFVDLISDTITLPTEEMLNTILTAPLGDAGRYGADGRGEDATTNKLEDMAAALCGKEAGLFFPSGTLGNTSAVLAFARPGSTILTEARQHIMVVEKFCFMEEGFRMKPAVYYLQPDGTFDIPAIRKELEKGGISLALIENTNNFAGGKCIALDQMKAFYEVCHEFGVPVHMDGARMFNALEGLGCTAAEMCQYVDSVMFCISKGLGAPIGSLVCGTKEMILKARDYRHLIGGTMRQSGIAAACGIYALEHNAARLKEDRENAQLMYNMLKDQLKVFTMTTYPESDILIFDISATGLDSKDFGEICKEHGVRGYIVSPTEYRFTFHLGITREDTIWAAERMLELDRMFSDRK